MCVRTDEEIRQELNPRIYRYILACNDSFFTKATRFMRTGYFFDTDDWIRKLEPITKGSTTFSEAFKRSGRILNITVTKSETRLHHALLLNYKTAPDVLIWSAILASSALPHMIPAVELLCKNADGSCKPFTAYGKCWYAFIFGLYYLLYLLRSDGSIKNDVSEFFYAVFLIFLYIFLTFF